MNRLIPSLLAVAFLVAMPGDASSATRPAVDAVTAKTAPVAGLSPVQIDKMSPEQMLEYMAGALTEMEGIEGNMEALQQKSAPCVQLRLALVRALTEITKLAEGSLKQALAIPNSELAYSAVARASLALDKARTIESQASECVRATDPNEGMGLVEQLGNKSAYKELDGTESLPDFAFDEADPPQASPFM